MAIASEVITNFNQVVNTYGVIVKVQMNTGSFVDADYDESLVYSTSGSLQAGSGITFPLGKNEIPYLEQGRLNQTDKILYLGNGFSVDSMADLVVNGGSYTIAPAGMKSYELEGSLIYNKIYIRGKI